MFLLSQIFAFFSAIVTVLCVWQKTRKRILFFLTLDGFFLGISYILLGAYSGAITNLLCICRNILFDMKESKPKLNKLYILFIFVTFHILIGMFLYDGLTSLLPVIAAIIFCFAAWNKNPKIVRIGTSIMLLLWLIYDIAICSYVSIITESVSFTSSLLAIIRLDILKKYNYTFAKMRKVKLLE